MTVMKRILAMKYLLLLDALLMAACVWMGVSFRRQWGATAAAYQVSNIQPGSVALKKAVEKQKSPQEFQKNYFSISSRNLFSPDRNDQIQLDVAAKPRPPKPILFGILKLTDAQLALMSTPDSREFRSLKVGEKMGEYTLTKILVNKVELKYENETVEATTEEQPRVVSAPVYPTAASGSPSEKVVSVSAGSGDASSALSPANSSSAAARPEASGSCKGKWVRTLFGMTCVEDQK